MNARQAAKAAAKRIEELEFRVMMNVLDIKDYNAVIEALIDGNSPCQWCEDWVECQLEAKGQRGCSEWILHNNAEIAKESTAEEVIPDGTVQIGGENEG